MEVRDLIDRIDIVTYIEQFCDIKQQGGEYWGLSPFKEEKTPSFSVNPEKQCFYDFSSGKGGNILDFVRAYHHCSFGDAVKHLKSYLGIEDEPTSSSPSAVRIARRFKKKEDHTKESTETILPDTYMDLYEMRPDKRKVWEDEGISSAVMDRYQVRYDPYSDRLVYPIRNTNGKIVNIGGRTLDPSFKEKQLRKYTYFKKWGGDMQVLFGLYENQDAIRKRGEIILFEGIKSVMLAETWGVMNCGALLTSHLNVHQFRFLLCLGVRVVFALDKDVNVTEDRNIQRLKRYLPVYAVLDKEGLLEEKMSPVDRGHDVWAYLYGKKVKI
ncbi:MAG: CHC2 zinc finger domain-containing protein [Bacteroides sp.]|nr:CHC2 zinc finger domain-containing protein [Eubacterium sp.]MCM1417646.1 CHC2 zinc finger domain-containing protein [Roseburia sp.]MCM1461889.1 CHC2 zinc finger domain-containing protein [Bacteroides sp.]